MSWSAIQIKTTISGLIAAIPVILRLIGYDLSCKDSEYFYALSTAILGWNAKDK